MKWFGENWGAPLNAGMWDWSQHVEVPLGQECPQCQDLIGAKDQGVIMVELGTWQDDDGDDHLEIEGEYPYHLDCFLAVLLGHAWFGRYIKQTNILESESV